MVYYFCLIYHQSAPPPAPTPAPVYFRVLRLDLVGGKAQGRNHTQTAYKCLLEVAICTETMFKGEVTKAYFLVT